MNSNFSTANFSTANFYAVVPAGGSGTRLWPLSRAGEPKFLHPLAGGTRSLLQSTLDRLQPLAPPERTLVVTGARHASAVARQLPELDAANIIIEPSPRDSAAAIGLAAAIIAERDPEAIMGSFAADHHIADPTGFVAAVRDAACVAADGYLATVGLTPTRPETGYGYLKLGQKLETGIGFAVNEFAEKPTEQRAEKYFASGEYLWNASMFVWRVAAMLAELERQQPQLYAGLRHIAADWETPRRDDTFSQVWPTLPATAIDYAIMEDAAARGRVATVPADIGWHDIGDWNAVGEIAKQDEYGNAVLGDSALVRAIDAQRCVVATFTNRTVALVGLDDVVVVDTPDAVLICSRERSQDVKQVVSQLDRDDPLR
ncbi:MAG: mannose-1-phosphate guanylyltransferase [Acidimicrobiales bacterium]|nr:MAG: mannose-1-phosphate guanylyltransferase [Acidimicrobiales bacterium]